MSAASTPSRVSEVGGDMYLLIRSEFPSIRLLEADDCRSLSIQVSECCRDQLAELLREGGLGDLHDAHHVALYLEPLHAFARSHARECGWEEQWEAMVRYARDMGWLLADGTAVRAHCQWLPDVDPCISDAKAMKP